MSDAHSYVISIDGARGKSERSFDNYETAVRFWETVAALRVTPDTNDVVEGATMTRSDGKAMHKAEGEPYAGLCVP